MNEFKPKLEEENTAADAPESQDPSEPAATPSLIELVLAHEVSPPALASRIEGIVTGRITSVEPSGAVRVTFPGAPPEGFLARLTSAIHESDQGREVALMYENGNPSLPIIMGKLVSPLAPSSDSETIADGRRVEINAEDEIVLRCGESSITLTRSGKIILRGNYVLSRSSGVNRIQGGSVEIN